MTTTEKDLRDAVQSLATDNARLCDRLIAAEKIIEAARLLLRSRDVHNYLGARGLKELIFEYDAGKPS